MEPQFQKHAIRERAESAIAALSSTSPPGNRTGKP
jgi:hypothetical protein